ncbi:hypothetical protein M0812_06198 [Anaeramoeba flamelloides]|uniref:E2F/DP family winged-helix DNA-binding domain-containing protein n=1 Tax=Anaeramoeba flamelloides TaxID=1746091 RepID=A0AAV8A9D5_9EUKA|nr:hypothetical protein M0812_06198 [Anaeramoeba flamelloides]
MSQNQELELFGFYPLLWQFGDYLFRKVKNDQIFCLSKFTQKFMSKYSNNPDLVKLLIPRINLIKSLFNQNYVFVRPDLGSRARARKRNKKNQALTNKPNSSSVYELQEDRFFLSPTWRKILLYSHHLKDYSTDKSISSGKKVSSRANRTIGVLGFSISKMLQNEPCTREMIESETGFSRQRICTVLSIYKSINLISDDQSNNYVYWNHGNGEALSEGNKYIKDVLLLRKRKRELAQRVLQLSKKMNNKIKEKIENIENGIEKEKQKKATTIKRLQSTSETIKSVLLMVKFLTLLKIKNSTATNQKEESKNSNGNSTDEDEDDNGMEIENGTNEFLNTNITSRQLIKEAKKAIDSIQESKKTLCRINEESKKHIEFNKLLFKKKGQQTNKTKNMKKASKPNSAISSLVSLSTSTSNLAFIKKGTSENNLKNKGSKKKKSTTKSKRKISFNNSSNKRKLHQKKKKLKLKANKSKSLTKNKLKKKYNKRKQNKNTFRHNHNHSHNHSHKYKYKIQEETLNGRLIEKWRKKSSEETEAILAILRLKTEKTETIEPITLMIDHEIQQLGNSSNNISFMKLLEQK